MVDKSRNIAMSGRIDYLPVLCPHHVGAGSVLVFFYALLAYIRIYIEHLADILHYELALFNELSCR